MIKIDKNVLLTFLLQQSMNMKASRKNFWESKAPSGEEIYWHYTHLFGAVLRVLAGESITEPQDIEDLIWVLTEYCHLELGIPRRVDIRHHLAQAVRTEPPLHVLRRYYRDHFFHALEVCLLGHLLLKTNWEGEPLWKLVSKHLGRIPKDEEAILRLWYITALLHDVGYGIELIKGAQKLIGFFKNADPLKTFVIELSKDMEKLSREIGNFEGLSENDKGGEDHGIIGALHLRKLLENIAKDNKSVKLEYFQPAIRAIANHNLRKKEKVSFQTDPFAFLLILCDTVQEWDRPRLAYDSAPYWMLSQMLGNQNNERQSKNDFEGPLIQLLLNVGLNSGVFRVDEKTLKIVLRFDEQINWDDSIFHTWIDASCNLQRLDMTGLDRDVDIEIEYQSPPSIIKNIGKVEQQLYRLREATVETRMNFLTGWFPNSQSSNGWITNGAVSYKYESQDETKLECLKLHLRKLTEIQPVTCDIDDFCSYLARWKRYNENRLFLIDYALPDSPGK